MRILALLNCTDTDDAQDHAHLVRQAVQIKQEQEAELILAIMGAGRTAIGVRAFQALGVDHIVVVPTEACEEGGNLVPLISVAKLIEEKFGKPDLLFCKQTQADAAMLNAPVMIAYTSMSDERGMVVDSEITNGVWVSYARVPSGIEVLETAAAHRR